MKKLREFVALFVVVALLVTAPGGGFYQALALTVNAQEFPILSLRASGEAISKKGSPLYEIAAWRLGATRNDRLGIAPKPTIPFSRVLVLSVHELLNQKALPEEAKAALLGFFKEVDKDFHPNFEDLKIERIEFSQRPDFKGRAISVTLKTNTAERHWFLIWEKVNEARDPKSQTKPHIYNGSIFLNVYSAGVNRGQQELEWLGGYWTRGIRYVRKESAANSGNFVTGYKTSRQSKAVFEAFDFKANGWVPLGVADMLLAEQGRQQIGLLGGIGALFKTVLFQLPAAALAPVAGAVGAVGTLAPGGATPVGFIAESFERFKTNLFDNELVGRVGQSYFPKGHQKLRQSLGIDPSRNILNVEQEMTQMGHPVAGAALAGAVEVLPQLPLILAGGLGLRWVAAQGLTGQRLAFAAGVAFGVDMSVAQYQATKALYAYQDGLTTREGLNAVRAFTTQTMLNAPFAWTLARSRWFARGGAAVSAADPNEPFIKRYLREEFSSTLFKKAHTRTPEVFRHSRESGNPGLDPRLRGGDENLPSLFKPLEDTAARMVQEVGRGKGVSAETIQSYKNQLTDLLASGRVQDRSGRVIRSLKSEQAQFIDEFLTALGQAKDIGEIKKVYHKLGTGGGKTFAVAGALYPVLEAMGQSLGIKRVVFSSKTPELLEQAKADIGAYRQGSLPENLEFLTHEQLKARRNHLRSGTLRQGREVLLLDEADAPFIEPALSQGKPAGKVVRTYLNPETGASVENPVYLVLRQMKQRVEIISSHRAKNLDTGKILNFEARRFERRFAALAKDRSLPREVRRASAAFARQAQNEMKNMAEAFLSLDALEGKYRIDAKVGAIVPKTESGQWSETLDTPSRRYLELRHNLDATLPYKHERISTIRDVIEDADMVFAFSGTRPQALEGTLKRLGFRELGRATQIDAGGTPLEMAATRAQKYSRLLGEIQGKTRSEGALAIAALKDTRETRLVARLLERNGFKPHEIAKWTSGKYETQSIAQSRKTFNIEALEQGKAKVLLLEAPVAGRGIDLPGQAHYRKVSMTIVDPQELPEVFGVQVMGRILGNRFSNADTKEFLFLTDQETANKNPFLAERAKAKGLSEVTLDVLKENLIEAQRTAEQKAVDSSGIRAAEIKEDVRSAQKQAFRDALANLAGRLTASSLIPIGAAAALLVVASPIAGITMPLFGLPGAASAFGQILSVALPLAGMAVTRKVFNDDHEENPSAHEVDEDAEGLLRQIAERKGLIEEEDGGDGILRGRPLAGYVYLRLKGGMCQLVKRDVFAAILEENRQQMLPGLESIFGPIVEQMRRSEQTMANLLDYLVKSPHVPPTSKLAWKTLEAMGVQMRYGVMPPGALAYFNPEDMRVVVSHELEQASLENQVHIIAHELQHAYDDLKNRPYSLEFEGRAFKAEAEYLNNFKLKDLPGTRPADRYLREFARRILALYKKYGQNPALFVDEITKPYVQRSGPYMLGLRKAKMYLDDFDTMLEKLDVEVEETQKKLHIQESALSTARQEIREELVKNIKELNERLVFIRRQIAIVRRERRAVGREVDPKRAYKLWVGPVSALDIAQKVNRVRLEPEMATLTEDFLDRRAEEAATRRGGYAYRLLTLLISTMAPLSLPGLAALAGVPDLSNERRADIKNQISRMLHDPKRWQYVIRLPDIKGALEKAPEFRSILWEVAEDAERERPPLTYKIQKMTRAGAQEVEVMPSQSLHIDLIGYWKEHEEIKNYLEGILSKLEKDQVEESEAGYVSQILSRAADHPRAARYILKTNTPSALEQFKELESKLAPAEPNPPSQEAEKGPVVLFMEILSKIVPAASAVNVDEIAREDKDSLVDLYINVLKSPAFNLMATHESNIIPDFAPKLRALAKIEKVRETLNGLYGEAQDPNVRGSILSLIEVSQARAMDIRLMDRLGEELAAETSPAYAPEILRILSGSAARQNYFEAVKGYLERLEAAKAPNLAPLTLAGFSGYLDKAEIVDLFVKRATDLKIDPWQRAQYLGALAEHYPQASPHLQRHLVRLSKAYRNGLKDRPTWKPYEAGNFNEEVPQENYLFYLSVLLSPLAQESVRGGGGQITRPALPAGGGRETGSALLGVMATGLAGISGLASLGSLGFLPALGLLGGLLGSILFHEFAHLVVLKRMGERVIYKNEPLSLNPFKRVDPFWTLLLPLASFGLSRFIPSIPVAGMAKPINVDFRNLRDAAYAGAAGPIANFLLAAGFGLLSLFSPAAPLLWTLAGWNVWLGILNLLPLPHMDGGKIVAYGLSKASPKFYRWWTGSPNVPPAFQGIYRRFYEGPSRVLSLFNIRDVRWGSAATWAATLGVMALASLVVPVPFIMLLPCVYFFYCIREKLQSEKAATDLVEIADEAAQEFAKEIADDKSIKSQVNWEELRDALGNTVEDVIDQVIASEGFESLSDEERWARFEAAYKETLAKVFHDPKSGLLRADDPEVTRRLLAGKAGQLFLSKVKEWIRKNEVWKKWTQNAKARRVADAEDTAVEGKSKNKAVGGTAASLGIGLLGLAGLQAVFPFLQMGLAGLVGSVADVESGSSPLDKVVVSADNSSDRTEVHFKRHQYTPGKVEELFIQLGVENTRIGPRRWLMGAGLSVERMVEKVLRLIEEDGVQEISVRQEVYDLVREKYQAQGRSGTPDASNEIASSPEAPRNDRRGEGGTRNDRGQEARNEGPDRVDYTQKILRGLPVGAEAWYDFGIDFEPGVSRDQINEVLNTLEMARNVPDPANNVTWVFSVGASEIPGKVLALAASPLVRRIWVREAYYELIQARAQLDNERQANAGDLPRPQEVAAPQQSAAPAATGEPTGRIPEEVLRKLEPGPLEQDDGLFHVWLVEEATPMEAILIFNRHDIAYTFIHTRLWNLRSALDRSIIEQIVALARESKIQKIAISVALHATLTANRALTSQAQEQERADVPADDAALPGDTSASSAAQSPEQDVKPLEVPAPPAPPSFQEYLDRPELELKPKEKGFLKNFLVDMKLEKKAPILGRVEQLQRVTKTVTSPRGIISSSILIGETGVGKTAIAERLSEYFKDRYFLRLNLDRLLNYENPVSGENPVTALRDIIEILGRLNDPDLRRGSRVILFVDQIERVFKNKRYGEQLVGLLKEPLRDGRLTILAATVPKWYKMYFESGEEADEELKRRLKPVWIGEPSVEDTQRMLEGARRWYEELLSVTFDDSAISDAAELSAKFDREHYLPAKAFDYLVDAARSAHPDVQRDFLNLEIEDILAKIAADAALAVAKTTSQSVVASVIANEVKQSHEKADSSDEIASPEARNDKEGLARNDGEGEARNDKEGVTPIDLYNQLVRLSERAANLYERRKNLNFNGKVVVVGDHVKTEIAKATGIESGQLSLGREDPAKYLNMEETLNQQVLGQEEAVGLMAAAVKTNKAGLSTSKRPVGVFYLTGLSGVGKTHLARKLAEFLFGDPDAVIRFDMSEYMAGHEYSKFIGSPPGYVGYGEGGQLTEKVRRKPYSVVLLDEIEKANPAIFLTLLQVMGEGRLTDGQGRTVDFSNTIFLMTSNLGMSLLDFSAYEKEWKEIRALELDYTAKDQWNDVNKAKIDGLRKNLVERLKNEVHRQATEITEKAMKDVYPAEFRGRLDEVIVFNPLTYEVARGIAKQNLKELADILGKAGHRLEYDEETIDYLVSEGFSISRGARLLRRAIKKHVDDKLAVKVLEAQQREDNSKTVISLKGKAGGIDIEVTGRQEPPKERLKPEEGLGGRFFGKLFQGILKAAGTGGEFNVSPESLERDLDVIASETNSASSLRGAQRRSNPINEIASPEARNDEGGLARNDEGGLARNDETEGEDRHAAAGILKEQTDLADTEESRIVSASHADAGLKDPAIKEAGGRIIHEMREAGYSEQMTGLVSAVGSQQTPSFVDLFTRHAKKFSPIDGQSVPPLLSWKVSAQETLIRISREGAMTPQEQEIMRKHFAGNPPANQGESFEKALKNNGQQLFFELHRLLTQIPGAQVGYFSADGKTHYWLELPRSQEAAVTDEGTQKFPILSLRAPGEAISKKGSPLYEIAAGPLGPRNDNPGEVLEGARVIGAGSSKFREYLVGVIKQREDRGITVRARAVEALKAFSGPEDLETARSWLNFSVNNNADKVAAAFVILARHGNAETDRNNLLQTAKKFEGLSDHSLLPFVSIVTDELTRLLDTDNNDELNRLRSDFEQKAPDWRRVDSARHPYLDAIYRVLAKRQRPDDKALLFEHVDRRRIADYVNYMKHVDPQELEAMLTNWRNGGFQDNTNLFLTAMWQAALTGDREDYRRIKEYLTSPGPDMETREIAARALAKITGRLNLFEEAGDGVRIWLGEGNSAIGTYLSNNENFSEVMAGILIAGESGGGTESALLERLMEVDPQYVNNVHEVTQQAAAEAWGKIAVRTGKIEEYLRGQPDAQGQPQPPYAELRGTLARQEAGPQQKSKIVQMLTSVNPILNIAAIEAMRLLETKRQLREQLAARGGSLPHLLSLAPLGILGLNWGSPLGILLFLAAPFLFYLAVKFLFQPVYRYAIRPALQFIRDTIGGLFNREKFFLAIVPAKDKHDRTRIQKETGATVLHEQGAGRVVVLATKEILEKLRQAGYAPLEIKSLRSFRPQDFPRPDEIYHNYAEMTAALKNLAAQNPDLVTLSSIGKSVEGRDIWALRFKKIGTDTIFPTGKIVSVPIFPGVLFVSNYHAREHLTAEMALGLAKYLVGNKNNPDIKSLLDNREITIIPMLNPDGVEFDIARDNYELWRKNRANNTDGSRGVDLNRNHSEGWGKEGASPDPRHETYRGPAPFSEPETRVVRDYVEKNPNIKTAISFHSFSELVLYPWGHTYDPVENAQDRQVFEKAAQTMAKMNGYKPQQGSDLYLASGEFTDWAYGKKNIFAFTFELSPKSVWDGGFYPGPKMIEKVLKANIRPALYLADIADNPHKILDSGFRSVFEDQNRISLPKMAGALAGMAVAAGALLTLGHVALPALILVPTFFALGSFERKEQVA
ncbi:MAG: AAA family ATPase [Elusimicrobia bacterium]|nr:AAA family ATPase [Elusimicrobiota bacterium]